MTHKLLTPPLVVFVLLAGSATAQDAPPPPRQPVGGAGAPGFPGRGPGRGGFFPGGEGALGLVGMPEVGQELKLSERQQQALNELRAATRQELQGIMATADPQLLQLLDPDQRELFFAEMRKKAEATNRTADEKLARLLDADQNQRLAQLRLQRDGAAALLRADIAKQLNLTDEQTTRLRAIPGIDAPPFGPPEARQQALRDVTSLFTPDQLATWKQLNGPEFKFPEPRFGPGGPGGFGPGAREPRPGMALRTFVEQRRQYLLDHEEIKKLPPAEGK